MKVIKNVLYFLYQWLIFMPIFLVITLITCLTVILFSPIFCNKIWGYYPPKWWSKLTCWLALCRVTTKGSENIDPNQSYVFVANHQSAFDIFLVYGFLNKNIKWVQKESLRRIPFVGKASEIAGHVFVNNSSAAARISTIKKAERQIVDGVSMMMFPEGSRTRTGKMTRFHKGAYYVAKDLKLQVVPITINGAYNVMKYGTCMIHPGKLELIIHKPISTDNLTDADIPAIIDESKKTIHNSLWAIYK
mgnify:CR=1 FL=1